MTAPLAGVRVLDLSEGDGAPFCAMQLGDAGADVIKVEGLEGDWARPLGPPFDSADGPLFIGMNRNKRSIAVDLDREEGLAVVRDLAASADILVESFPKAADATRMGLDYDTLSAANDGLIYCDLSPLGRQGPNADKPATDLIVQGISGVTRFAGERGTEPVRFGSNYAGVTASMYAMQAILAALYWRRQSGEGQYIETSFLMGMIATQQNYTTAFSDPDDVGSGGGFYTSHLEPPSHGYATKDRAIEFTLGYVRDPNALQTMLERVGALDEVHADPQIGDRPIASEDLGAVTPYLSKAFLNHSSEELLQLLDELGVMCSPVHDYDSMFHDEGILEQDMLLTLDHPTRGEFRTGGLPWKLTDTPGSVRLAPPTLGEHTDAVLAEIGYDGQRIAALRADGVIR